MRPESGQRTPARLAGVIIVTGGSRGIGAATAVRLAEAGNDVVVSYRSRRDEAEAVVARCAAAGVQAGAIEADVAEEADVVALFEQAVERFGPLTGLVANAGIVDMAARLDTFSAERVARMMAVNVTGQIVCAREAVLRHVHGARRCRRLDRVRLVGRVARRQPRDVRRLRRVEGRDRHAHPRPARRRWPTEGVRVNAVRPGIIRTEIHADSGDVDRPAKAAASLPMRPPRRTRGGRRRDRLAHVGRGRLHERRDPRRERCPLMAEVRRATSDDIDELVRLRQVMFDSMEGVMDTTSGWEDAVRRGLPARVGRRLGGRVRGRCARGRRAWPACGVATVAARLPGPGNLTGRYGYVQSMATDERWRRRGYGRDVFAALVDWFRAEGITAVDLHATTSGEPLYRSFGFREGETIELRWRARWFT